MGHRMPTMIGVDQKGIAQKINRLVPDYMAMGEKGGSMGSMEMPLPDNTLPMMTGEGPFGNIEMGGMFTMVKIRRDQKPGDYADPGWYRHPPGTVSYEWTGETPAAPRAPQAGAAASDVNLTVRKPQAHKH